MARILILDDDPTILALEKLILTDEGHDVLVAENARSALDILSIYPVDLMIIDVTMPELNGFRFVNIVRNSPKLKDTPIAFLTARNEKQDVVRAGELGADFYLMKPIVRTSFVKKVSDFFEKRKPAEYPYFRLETPSYAEVKICHSTQILSVSDLAMEIATDTPLEADQTVELSAKIFHEIPLKNPVFRVQSVQPLKKGGYKARVILLNGDENTVKKISRWVTYEILKQGKKE